MAKSFSQDNTPAFTENPNPSKPVTPERDSWLIRASIIAFGPRKQSTLDRPYPDITDGLVERVRRVSASIEHARQHPEIKFALKLVEAGDTYNDIIKQLVPGLKVSKSDLFKRATAEIQTKPATFEDFRRKLTVEFEVWNGSSTGRNFFHYRNNVAYLYQRELEKAGRTAELLPKPA